MRHLAFLLLFAVLVTSCNLEKFSEDTEGRATIQQNQNDDPLNDPNVRAEFNESNRKLKFAKKELQKAGHILPGKLKSLDDKSVEWVEHIVHIQLGRNEIKRVQWKPGYVISKPHHSRPIYKVLDLNLFKEIEAKMEQYLMASKVHFNSYQDLLNENELLLIELQFNLVEQTLNSYKKKIAGLRIEDGKIKTMTWGEILAKWTMDELVWCDTEIDMINLANLVLEDNQFELVPLERDNRVRSLKGEDSGQFDVNKSFKVYQNYFIYIQ